MKTYLVLAAQNEELNGMFEGLSYDVIKEDGRDIYVYEDAIVRIYGLISGIGKVAMSLTMGLFLAKHKVDEIINIGVAGSISPKLKKMQTFVATRCAYHDVDLVGFGKVMGQMSGMPLYFECDTQMVEKAVKIDKERIIPGLILSGDSFITKENVKKSWFEDFEDPIACDMESAAVAQVAYMMHIPFVIIRSISDDTSEEGSLQVYEGNLEDASKLAGNIACRLIFENSI